MPDETNRDALWAAYYEAVLVQDIEGGLAALGRLDKAIPGDPEVMLKTGELLGRGHGGIGQALVAYHRSAEAFMRLGREGEALSVYKIILGILPDDELAYERSIALVGMLEEEAREDIESPVSPGTPASRGKELTGAPEISNKVPAIFDTLPPETYRALCSAALHRSYENGEAVVREGEPGDSIYTIQSGKAMVTTEHRGNQLVMATLSEGDFFGEMALLAKEPRTATVSAFGDLRVMEITKDTLKTVADSHPEVIKGLVAFYTKRAKDSTAKLKADGRR